MNLKELTNSDISYGIKLYNDKCETLFQKYRVISKGLRHFPKKFFTSAQMFRDLSIEKSLREDNAEWED